MTRLSDDDQTAPLPILTFAIPSPMLPHGRSLGVNMSCVTSFRALWRRSTTPLRLKRSRRHAQRRSDAFGLDPALDRMPLRSRNASTSFLQTSGAWYHIWCPASGSTIVSRFGSRRANSLVMSPRNGYDLAPDSSSTGALILRIVGGSILGKRVPVVIITSHSCASRSVSSRADSDILSHAWGSLKT